MNRKIQSLEINTKINDKKNIRRIDLEINENIKK